MASNTNASSSDGAKEYTVRVPRTSNKKFSIMKFNPANKVDFTKCENVKIERENNLKQYKVANDIDMAPQFGAGSEFGREQREEARRKKFGFSKRVYSPEDQPWLLKMGGGKTARKFKGVKEGGITENASYYVFKQSPDGAFEAFPLHEWYNFTPVAKYKSLNAEEAEEEFNRRDKTLNFFSIMVNKRLKKDEDAGGAEDGEEGKPKTKKSKKDKDFLLTEMDEWAMMLDSDEEGSGGEGSEDEKKPKKKQKKKKVRKLAKRKGSDGEAEEESDDVDEGREVDYMTDTDSEDDEMYTDNVKTDKYEETGVEDAEGLRKIIESDEEEEEEKKEDEEQEEEAEQEEEKKEKKDSDSGESSSDSDSDLDKDENIMSALFMQKREKKKKGGSKENSRSNTPTVDDNKAQKRKTGDTDSPAAKKSRSASPAPPASTSTSGTSSAVSAAALEGITEEAVRRYLMRKPMTTKDLLQKFKSKNPNIQKDKLVTGIAAILKKLNPEKSKVKDKLFLHIRKT